MTEVRKFVDRRTKEEVDNGLATQILYWYDSDEKGRRRTNAIAITNDRKLVVASSTCSKKDNFEKSKGRMIARKRLLGRAKENCWTLPVGIGKVDFPTRAAAAYKTISNDERGHKRAYNAGKIFEAYALSQG